MVRPYWGMPSLSSAPRARGPGRPQPARARGSPEVAGARAAERQRKSPRFPLRMRRSRALAAAPAERQGPGPEPGARRTGRRHGVGALGVGFSPAWPGQRRVSGLRRLPAPEPLRGNTRALSAHGAHQPRLASRLSSGLSLRCKAERENEKKGRAVMKRRVRLEGAEQTGVPSLLLRQSRGFFLRIENALSGERQSVEEKRCGRLTIPSLRALPNPAKVA